MITVLYTRNIADRVMEILSKEVIFMMKPRGSETANHSVDVGVVGQAEIILAIEHKKCKSLRWEHV